MRATRTYLLALACAGLLLGPTATVPAGGAYSVDGVGVVIDQVDESGDYVYDFHGTYCLEGTVEVVLDSTVNSGSDSVFGIKLEP